MLRTDTGLITWALTDGKAGDELQVLSITDALGLTPEIRRVRPKAPFSWFMPWGPIDPRERPGSPHSPLAPPFPDLVIASGRRAVAYLRHLKKATGGRAYTVFLKDPRTGPTAADFIWSPTYDRLRGPNVLNTLTPPHRVSARRLEEARARPDPRLSVLPGPRIAVLAGGNSRHHRFSDEDVARFVGHLSAVARTGAGLMVTVSRRTPPALRQALTALTAEQGGFLWEGTGDNPYVDLLALADYIVATADSFNMMGEAAVTGRPILVFEPSGGHPKLDVYLQALKDHGVVHPFEGRLEGQPYEPLNSTPKVAEAIAEGLSRHRRALGLPDIALSLETP
ncbi:mitochondrial fission ELM1 family protein [Microvirga terrae]|uniref:Mitochondrial fission ELM1 family protein n=1 Tax=Microvirga terrae TaxID=2740529 RepID=A0ABY5RY26_9HYPH|nr:MULTISPECIES: mitochondrial fission ELM1 family protein [Microvirga]MBQ0820287.1 mitochondrial fission ELM1 family protein [Microvirga sp. HBU67558]UVF20844.1 mitochondrial fission ELM1 family protein [Microvirga terrae]